MADYLYEQIEDYKDAESKEEQAAVFQDFCSSLWSSRNQRRVYTKVIRYSVEEPFIQTRTGQIFDAWSRLEYKGYQSSSKETDWCSLIRQKINNLYTRYFDKEVVLQKDYLELLHTPKELYYQWRSGREWKAGELDTAIQDAMSRAEQLKAAYQNQKMVLSWQEYTQLMEGFLQNHFRTCKRLEEYETPGQFQRIYDFMNEDNFYIRYFCQSLEGDLRKWQKQYYGVREHQRYRRCIDCGCLFELHSYNQKRCPGCQASFNRRNKTEKQRSYRVEKLKS
ncbi:MAG: hypothetical protein NC089_09480 [Bacteroides sp.]|nr:hypothetical protein [Bacteroides sp.]MCM1549612.1 hypothetical protein [Clostridium sp.]